MTSRKLSFCEQISRFCCLFSSIRCFQDQQTSYALGFVDSPIFLKLKDLMHPSTLLLIHRTHTHLLLLCSLLRLYNFYLIQLGSKFSSYTVYKLSEKKMKFLWAAMVLFNIFLASISLSASFGIFICQKNNMLNNLWGFSVWNYR